MAYENLNILLEKFNQQSTVLKALEAVGATALVSAAVGYVAFRRNRSTDKPAAVNGASSDADSSRGIANGHERPLILSNGTSGRPQRSAGQAATKRNREIAKNERGADETDTQVPANGAGVVKNGRRSVSPRRKSKH